MSQVSSMGRAILLNILISLKLFLIINVTLIKDNSVIFKNILSDLKSMELCGMTLHVTSDL